MGRPPVKRRLRHLQIPRLLSRILTLRRQTNRLPELPNDPLRGMPSSLHECPLEPQQPGPRPHSHKELITHRGTFQFDLSRTPGPRNCGRLEGLNLIRSSADSEDRRSRAIHLTSKGSKVVARFERLAFQRD